MPSWLTIPEETIKPVVSFLLNRYVGDLLLGKVSRDQLSIDLVNSTGSINDVNLNVQYINDALAKADVPLELIDGYINSLVVQVPLMTILEDSCSIEITGLEITVQPRPYVAADIITSMFESMVGSMTTSIDLARSFVEEQGSFNLESEDQNVKGIDALAYLIEIVLSRMKVIFHDTIIRVEHFPSGAEGPGIALEIHIEKLEFIDELLADVESDRTAPVTVQPQSVASPSSSEMCKIMRLHGVRLSTDIFSKPSDALCKSVFLRSTRKNGEASMSSSTELNQNLASIQTSIYQSVSSSATPSFQCPTSSLLSKPLQFAEFGSERMFIKVRLKNDGSNQAAPGVARRTEHIDVEMFLGSLNLFLTPTQVHLLYTLVAAFVPDSEKVIDPTTSKNKPMQPQDFAKVEWDLKQTIDGKRAAGSRQRASTLSPLQQEFHLGNWSGDDHFYMTSRQPKTLADPSSVAESAAEFISIAMSSDTPGPELLDTMHWKLHSAAPCTSARRKSSHADKPETTRCKVLLSSLWVTLTHEDVLSASSNPSTASEALYGTIANFFECAGRIHLSAGTVLGDIRKNCESAYDRDHLRFIGCPFVVEYTSQCSPGSSSRSSTDRAADIVQLQVTSGNCELVEYLSARSVWSPSGCVSEEAIYVDLLTFDRSSASAAEKPDFTMKLIRDGQRQGCNVSLRPCFVEFDVSIVDRLCNLLFCQPPFKLSTAQQQSLRQKYLFEVPVDNLSLRDDLFEPLEQKPSATEVTFELSCPSLVVDLRFPVPDMRSVLAVDRRPWWARHVRDEILRLQFDTVKLCTLFNESMSKQGRFAIEFDHGTAFLNVNCKDDFVKFLGAYSPDRRSSASCGKMVKTCSVEVKWDFVSRSLLDERHGGTRMSEGSSGGENSLEKHCFQLNSTLDGPFSKKAVVHENEQLTIVGNSDEITEFKRSCLRRCELGISVNIPDARLYLPGKDIFALLYNRIANDMVFWSPSSPGFHSYPNDARSATAYSVHVTGLGLDGELFAPFKSMHKCDGSESESEISEGGRTLNARTEKTLEGHRLTFLFQCDKLDAVVTMPVKDEADSDGILKLYAEGAEVFVVSGYDGDENTVYCYVTTRTLVLHHGVAKSDDIDAARSESALFDIEQGLLIDAAADKLQLHCVAEPTPLRLSLKREPGDNFCVALRSCLDPKRNIKDLLVTLGFRNTTLHYRVQPSGHYWIKQLIDFFDVTNDPILGCELPKVITELHAHGWCMALEHRLAQLPYVLRCYVDSLDVSSNIVEEASMFRLHFIFEDSSLFLLASKSDLDAPLTAYVCLMKMGFFELVITSTEPPPANQGERASGDALVKPLLEIRARNDVLEIRTCSDSLAALGSIVQQLAQEGTAVSGDAPEENGTDDGATATNGMVMNGVVAEAASEKASSDDELRDMMAAAMEDAIVPRARTIPAGRPVLSETKAMVRQNGNAAASQKVKLPEPTIRLLSEDPVKIVEYHFSSSTQRSNLFAGLPPGYPTPLVQYIFRDISVSWFMYGGCDLGDTSDERKSYSAVQRSRCSPKVNQKFYEAKENLFTAGGMQRDHSVCVALHLNKICFLHELFPPGRPQVAREVMTIQDVEMHDLLSVSSINKLLYQYAADQKPRRTYVPMVCVKMLHVVPRDGKEMEHTDGECCLKVSILPLRLNIDQDTLQFLQDFSKESAEMIDGQERKGQSQRKRRVSCSAAPVIKVGPSRSEAQSKELENALPEKEEVTEDTHCLDRTTPPASFSETERKSLDVDLLADARRDAAGPISGVSSNGTAYFSQPSRSSSDQDDLLDINRPDSSDEDQLCVELFAPPNFESEADETEEEPQSKGPSLSNSTEQRPLSSAGTLPNEPIPQVQPTIAVTFRKSLRSEESEDGEQMQESITFSKQLAPCTTSRQVPEMKHETLSSKTSSQLDDSEQSSETAQNEAMDERDMMKLFATPIPTTEGGLYFKSFTFSPDLVLRIDYHGKRIQTEQGAIVGLLMGLSQLHCTELRLKELNNRHGLLGFDKVVNYALLEWLRDIRRNQLYNIVGGVGPMHSLVQIALGIRDLFWLPVDQYRRDGHIVKGMQRGVQSFGLSTATATLELGQKLFGAIQFMAEFAFDVVNPDYHRQRSQADILQAFAQPTDFREGVTLAMDAFRRGFYETAQAIMLATQEERASGRWAIRGVLRQATPTVLRPVVVFSQATTHVLGGLRNQLRPDARREEKEKWKND